MNYLINIILTDYENESIKINKVFLKEKRSFKKINYDMFSIKHLHYYHNNLNIKYLTPLYEKKNIYLGKLSQDKVFSNVFDRYIYDICKRVYILVDYDHDENIRYKFVGSEKYFTTHDKLIPDITINVNVSCKKSLQTLIRNL